MKSLKQLLPGFLALTFLFVSATGLWSWQMDRGMMRLVVGEQGHFSLYSTSDVVHPLYVPLFWAADPTTTIVTVKLGNQSIVLGKDKTFVPHLLGLANGVQITWVSPQVQLVETWEFVVSEHSRLADGVKWSFQFSKNALSQEVGLRIILDTYLGEKKDAFYDPAGKPIDAETSWQTPPLYLISRSPLRSDLGLLVMLSDPSSPVPDQTVVANWQRLDNTSWDYKSEPGHDFNLLPYSYHDSAIALWYQPQLLPPGSSREISLVMGSVTAGTFKDAKLGSWSLGALLDTAKQSDSGLDKEVRKALAIVDSLLAQIDERRKNADKVSQQDIQILQATLDQLEQQRQKLLTAR
ncbi:MAG: hypothetical protein HKM05_11575 [Spirochaetales bacterium]|nr:hypothetical protein [Spirochaetales bacterium]